MKRIVVSNQKGGVGKTTLALHVAARAQELGYRTLLIDLDAQGSATLSAAPSIELLPQQRAEVLWDDELAAQPLNCGACWSGIHLLGASDNLAGVDALDWDISRQAMQRLPDGYDVVVFDTPPAAGPRQIVPMLDADVVVSPLEPDIYAQAGLVRLVQALHTVIEANPALDHRVVINRLQARSSAQAQAASQIAERVGYSLEGEPLRAREIVRQARDRGMPVWQFAKRDPASAAWLATCTGILQ